jgi:hypothetical protein
VHVDFETVRAEREPVVERVNRILGPQGGAAAVRVDERALPGQMSCSRQELNLNLPACPP